MPEFRQNSIFVRKLSILARQCITMSKLRPLNHQINLVIEIKWNFVFLFLFFCVFAAKCHENPENPSRELSQAIQRIGRGFITITKSPPADANIPLEQLLTSPTIHKLPPLPHNAGLARSGDVTSRY